jgi:hypothetical protein
MSTKFRFWTIWNSDIVKISVSEECPIEMYRFEYTDEGFSSLYRKYYVEDNILNMEEITDGRDCDGRLTNTKYYTWNGNKRYSEDFKVDLLVFTKKSERVFDEYAVMAGY